MFQYRKRYEVTCDIEELAGKELELLFQYRKRYEVTCDYIACNIPLSSYWFQYRKRYEVTCDNDRYDWHADESRGSNTASGMRSHVTGK